ncbi:predicted protein [Nematostella vectensis]|uniref:Uncharacterized protein n=1 Tax=Nematostella vectensis TaxID=45351 RepID=A7S3N4_NEMVE|nr:predicted protein [Nematostella vectensis]|eukprot:XP_001633702.1 predicted protein [Nematostella vectensis]
MAATLKTKQQEKKHLIEAMKAESHVMAKGRQDVLSLEKMMVQSLRVCGPGRKSLGFRYKYSNLNTTQQTSNGLQIREIVGVLEDSSKSLPRITNNVGAKSDLNGKCGLLTLTTTNVALTWATRQNGLEATEQTSIRVTPIETVLKRQHKPKKYTAAKYRTTLKSFKRMREKLSQSKVKRHSRENSEAHEEWTDGITDFGSSHVSPAKSDRALTRASGERTMESRGKDTLPKIRVN